MDPTNPLIKTSLNVRCVWVHNVHLLQEVKVAHIDHCAGHLLDADILDVPYALQEGQCLTSCLTVEQLLDKLIGTDWMEDLVIAELPQIEVLVQTDAPSEESLVHFRGLELGEGLVGDAERSELEAVSLAWGLIGRAFGLFLDFHALLLVGV